VFPRQQDQPRRSRLSLRIAVLGGVAVALFAILFFRLWNLQVLDGSKYLAEAQNNRTREYRVIAPRGEILDREGEVLVDNRTSQALVITPSKLPSDPAKEKEELEKLGGLVHMDLKRVREVIAEKEEVAAGAPVTLRKDIGYPVVFYVEEHQPQFPGVSIQRVFVRAYPDGTRAAHVLGYASEVTEEELEEPQNKELQPGDEVGQAGVESAFDSVLQGKPGVTKVQVDAMGQPTPGGQLVSEPPEPGNNLVLTLNSKVQTAGEQALSEFGLPGAFVSMNIHTGEILGMGSSPTFEPKVFTEPKTQKQVNELFGDPELGVLTNRATESAYPTGSTYKIITALAALENGVVTPDTVIQDNGCIELAGEPFCNAEGAVNGPISLVHALQVSSDVYFYELGRMMWDKNYLQEWSHELGIARPTGFELGERDPPGLVPSKQWRDHLYKLYTEGKPGGTERPWSAGDNVQLATGQGDLQTTPLQMAVAYATLGTGGKVPTPHVGLAVQDPRGQTLKEFQYGVRRHVHIDPTWRRDILEGLHEAAQVSGGTAAPVFESFPIEIAGKTGTAERPGHADQSWFIALSPYPEPDIVTVVTIEEGGFGAHAAAPAAREILEALYAKKIKESSEKASEGSTEEAIEEPIEEATG
jgi:penicillin-binding protein 2